MNKSLRVGTVTIGQDNPLTIIAGPCVAESEDLCMEIARAINDRCIELGMNYIFKASFDKANRSSISSPRGPGLDEGLGILTHVREELNIPVTTDIHEPEQAEPVAAAADLLQIPAFLCRQTNLLLAAAATGKPVNAKKGQFMSPAEMANVSAKLDEGYFEAGHEPHPDGQTRVMVTERGTFFGYHRLVNDFVGLGDLMDLGCPVCFDATHSTQMPGGGSSGTTSGGRPDRAPLLARAAVAAGVDAVFIETHPEPENALSDASSMMPLDEATELLGTLAAIANAAKT